MQHKQQQLVNFSIEALLTPSPDKFGETSGLHSFLLSVMDVDKDSGQESKTLPLYKDCRDLEMSFIP